MDSNTTKVLMDSIKILTFLSAKYLGKIAFPNILWLF